MRLLSFFTQVRIFYLPNFISRTVLFDVEMSLCRVSSRAWFSDPPLTTMYNKVYFKCKLKDLLNIK